MFQSFSGDITLSRPPGPHVSVTVKIKLSSPLHQARLSMRLHQSIQSAVRRAKTAPVLRTYNQPNSGPTKDTHTDQWHVSAGSFYSGGVFKQQSPMVR